MGWEISESVRILAIVARSSYGRCSNLRDRGSGEKDSVRCRQLVADGIVCDRLRTHRNWEYEDY